MTRKQQSHKKNFQMYHEYINLSIILMMSYDDNDDNTYNDNTYDVDALIMPCWKDKQMGAGRAFTRENYCLQICVASASVSCL